MIPAAIAIAEALRQPALWPWWGVLRTIQRGAPIRPLPSPDDDALRLRIRHRRLADLWPPLAITALFHTDHQEN